MGSSNDEVNGVNGTPPDLPPRIDRNSKPVRTVNGRSAQERLFGNGGSKELTEPPNYINATPHRLPNATSLGRHNSNANSSTNMNNKTVRSHVGSIRTIFGELKIHEGFVFVIIE